MPTTTLSAHKDIRTSWLPLRAPSLSISLSLSGAPSVSLERFGASRIHRCRNATRSAVHESGATPSLTTSR
ncbi:MAG: hypothetical protein ACK55Z_10160, partial [bacterium]